MWLAVVNLITEAFTSMTKGRDELYCFKIVTQAQLSLFFFKAFNANSSHYRVLGFALRKEVRDPSIK